MCRRDIVPIAVLLVLFGLLALFAWLTRAPEAPFFERAVRLPFVGTVVERVRDRYLPPSPPAPPPAPPPSPTPGELAREGSVEVAFEELLRSRLGETVLLAPGTELRSAPEEGAVVHERLERAGRFAVLEHRGPWIRVRRSPEESAWVDPRLDPDAPPPLGMEPVPPGPLDGHPPPPERLVTARSVMGEGAREGWLGPYRLLTDLSEPPLELQLQRLARDAGPRYVERYGLELAGEAAEAIVLFDDEAAYRQYESIVPRLVGVGAEGHASLGIVSLYRGGRSRLDVALTLLHELGHLLNRRGLGPALPSWLDEGMAEEFSHAVVATHAEPSVDPFRRRDGETEHLLGHLASLKLVVVATTQGRLEGLPALLDRDWSSFATGPEAPLHYAHAELWVRFLFTGTDESARRGFRSFLDGVRRGESVEAEALRQHLGASWEELDWTFRAWLLRTAEDAGLVQPEPEPQEEGEGDGGARLSSSRQAASPSA